MKFADGFWLNKRGYEVNYANQAYEVTPSENGFTILATPWVVRERYETLGGANLEIIGDSAFSGCKALKTFTIGAKVTRIGKRAFYKCSALRKITIKTRLLTAKTVGASAFKGIYPAATIKVPKAVKKDYTKWLLKKGVKKTMKIK